MYLPMQQAPCVKRLNYCIRASNLQSSGLWRYNRSTSKLPKKRNQNPSPKLSFSWWVLLGSLGPGTQGDSCFGTCYTPATATRIRGKSIGTETLWRDAKSWTFLFYVGSPIWGNRKKNGMKRLERHSPQRTVALTQRPCTSALPGTCSLAELWARAALGAAQGSACRAVWGYLGGLVLSPTHVAELAATAAPVFQLVLQGPLALL